MCNNNTYFNDKGTSAEVLLHEIASKTFFSHWSYLNPKKEDGKEICDLLVVFDDSVIVWQLKNVKLKGDLIKDKDYNKNKRQLFGAYDFLSQAKKTIVCDNMIYGKEEVDMDKVQNFYLISTFFGKHPISSNMSDKYNGRVFHVFTESFTKIVLSELDTISDFLEYLRCKEEFINQGSGVLSDYSEEGLLAFYLSNGRSFDVGNKNNSFLYIDEGCWDEFVGSELYYAKKEEDKKSRFWDELINQCLNQGGEYKTIAREMARHDRYQRTVLSCNFLKIIDEAKVLGSNHSRRCGFGFDAQEIGYVFYAVSNVEKSISETEIKKLEYNLKALTIIMRGKGFNRKTIIGIAYSNFISECAISYFYLNLPEWNTESQVLMENLIKETGFYSRVECSKQKADDVYPYY